MTLLAAREGYGAATIGEVIALAGVSRPTLYQYFTDKEDCFLAALAPIQEQLLADIHKAVHSQASERATTSVIGALIGFACSQPTMARLLMSEPLAGGRRALDARDQRIGEIAQIIEDAYRHVPPNAVIPDLCSRVLVGAVCRLLASRLCRGEPPRAMLKDLLGWVDSYGQPVGEHRWRTLAAVPPPARSPFLPSTPLRAPLALAPGRPRIPEEAVAENHWLRILFATAEAVQREGYAAATVAEITRLAGVDGRVFYRLFADKREALGAVHGLLFRHVMAVTAGAFATGESWPEHVWEAARAFTQCVEQNPTLASVSLVESYAGGPVAMRRVEEMVCAFTIFLQEGYRYERRGAARLCSHPSPLALEAIVTTVLELGYQQARGGRGPRLSVLLPHVAFISLAPFLGAAETNEFLDQKTRAGHEHVLPADEQRSPERDHPVVGAAA